MSGKEDQCYKLKVAEIELLKKELDILKKRTTILFKTGNKDEVADAYVSYMTLTHRINAEEETLKLREAIKDKDIDKEANELSMKMVSNGMLAMFDNKMASLSDNIDKNPKDAISQMMGEFTNMITTVTEAQVPRQIKKKDTKVEIISEDESSEEQKPKKKSVEIKKTHQSKDKSRKK